VTASDFEHSFSSVTYNSGNEVDSCIAALLELLVITLTTWLTESKTELPNPEMVFTAERLICYRPMFRVTRSRGSRR